MKDLLRQVGLEQGELKGQVAVVTGGGRGIGRATAMALALLGAKVAIADLADDGADAARAIQEAGGEALFVKTDLSSPTDVAALAASVRERFGPATILINNAILCPVAPVSEMDLDLWDRVIAVNLRGAFLTVKAFLPAMRQMSSGTIINMISTDAMPGLSAYIASKQALTGFTQSLAAEVGTEGVRVIAFGPGMVDTPGLRAVGSDLAPLLGMQPEQFFSLSLHQGYDGLMPAEHAGLATAYLIARLAEECHGESVTGYTVLERAGLLAAPSLPGAAAAALTSPEATGTSRSEALQLADRLHALLTETAADFEKLPLFVRPLARSGFKSKAGQSIQDWQRSATELRSRLEQGEAVDTTRLNALLERLIAYVQAVPAETARFTRDSAFLRQVSERMAAYETDLRALIRALS